MYMIQIIAAAQWALRGLVVLAGGAGLVGCLLWAPMALSTGFLIVGLVGVGLSVAKADSWAPGLSVAIPTLWWLIGGASAPLWQAGVVAMCLALFHFGVGIAAIAPPWAGADRRAIARWLCSAGLYLGACLVGCALVVGVVAAPVPRGPVWVWLGVVVAMSGAVVAVRLTGGDGQTSAGK